MKDQTMSRRSKLIVTGALAMFAMGGLRAEATTNESDEHKPVPPANEEKAAMEAEAQARASQTIHHFSIPAGTLTQVAAGIEKETGLKIAIPAKVADVASPGVQGAMTSQEAFEAALQGTGLAAKFVSADHVVVDIRTADQNVTVTADNEPASIKYTAAVRDLPQTLTVIPEAVLQNTGSTTLIEALRTVSGITFGAGEGGNPVGDRPYIRGVDSQSSTFVDNMRDIGAQSREVFDVETIEVSKGPSGGFVGRGAGGGSINLNSKLARKERSLTASFSPATANFYRGTVDGDMKFTNWMAGRINGMAQDSDVAGRDAVHDGRYGFAPALLFNLSERGRFYLNYYDLRTNSLQDPGIPYNNPTFFARTDGRQQIFTPGDGQPLVVNRKAFYGLTDRDFRHEKAKSVFGRVEFDLGKGVILRNSFRYGKSNQDYVDSQADDSQGNIYYGLLYRRALQRYSLTDSMIDQTDLAGTAKTGSIKHTFATGFEFARERSWNGTYTVSVPFYAEAGSTAKLSASRCPQGAGAAGGYFCTDLFHPTYGDPWKGFISANAYASATATTTTAFTNSIVKTNFPTRQLIGTRSVYGFDTIQFLPQLLATVGLRYDHYNAVYHGATNCIASATVSCYSVSPSDLVNYQGALTYKPVTSLSLYGSVASSATPPGNSLAQGSDPSGLATVGNSILAPEKNRTVETGVKVELFRTKALATAAWFESDTENVRITQSDLSIAASGARRIRGLDFGLSGNVTRKVQLFGGYTFMNAILQHTGVTNGIDGLMDGRRFPNTPQNSFSLTGYYQATHKLNVGGGLYATGKVYGADNPFSQYTTKWVPGYVRVDLFGAYSINKHFQVQANLQNVGDKIYFLQAYTTHYAQLAPGRQGRLTLTYRF